jgi:hypothetical protein
VKKKLLCSFALVACSASAFAFSKSVSYSCDELGPGAQQTFTESFRIQSKFATRVIVTVTASNNGTFEAPKCHATWTIRSSRSGISKILFTYRDNPPLNENGVEFRGNSSDGTKLLLDFYTAGGEYTNHRPAVYDFSSSTWQMREVGTRVMDKFPKCVYLTMVQGTTDNGDVILYVPKDLDNEKTCPDQGEWLLEMKSNAITRMAKKDAAR